MTAKWKQIQTYHDSKTMHESKFNITKKQAKMILDLKKDELKKMRFLAMLDIDKDEVKQLAKKDPSIVRAIGRQGGSFRTSLVRKRANEHSEPHACHMDTTSWPSRRGHSHSRVCGRAPIWRRSGGRLKLLGLSEITQQILIKGLIG